MSCDCSTAAIQGGLSHPVAVAAVSELLFMINYGYAGIPGPKTISLNHPLQPGATISVEASSNIQGTINLVADNNNIALHIDCRIKYILGNVTHTELILNTKENGIWHEDQNRPERRYVVLPLHVSPGFRSIIAVVYEKCGYRVFINEEEQYFFKHRLCASPGKLVVKWEKIYKIVVSN